MQTIFKKKIEELLASAKIVLNGTAPHDPQVHDPKTYSRALLQGNLGLGDAYTDGMWDCDDLDVFFEKILRTKLDQQTSQILDILQKVRGTVFNLQSIRRAFHVAEGHYDLGNDLYELMLGESMGYSSGYYGLNADNNTQAQYDKFEIICQKLKLKPGMKILEIGCGWGTFAEYAVKNYGVSVLGVTVSKEQLAYAKKRCRDLDVEFYFGDYRTLPEKYMGAFDCVVSIEMIESVGIKNLKRYMQVISRNLRLRGKACLQCIIGNDVPDLWISTRIFPNGVLPSMKSIASSISSHMRISHLESFGLDYDKTLMEWDKRFRENWKLIQKHTDKNGKVVYDDKFYRMWRYYLMICAGSFRARKIDVCQIILEKEGITS